MNPNIKEQWVAALRSGEYTQGQQTLRTRNDTFCCLGVLCDLAAKSGHGYWAMDEEGWAHRTREEDGIHMPAGDVALWSGLPWDHQKDLATLNDDEGWDFHMIATYIEEKF